MEGKYIFNVASLGLATLGTKVARMAKKLGAEEIIGEENGSNSLFINLDDGNITWSPLSVAEHERAYGLEGVQQISAAEFEEIEQPAPKIELAIAVLGGSDQVRNTSFEELSELGVTEEMIRDAADKAIAALPK